MQNRRIQPVQSPAPEADTAEPQGIDENLDVSATCATCGLPKVHVCVHCDDIHAVQTNMVASLPRNDGDVELRLLLLETIRVCSLRLKSATLELLVSKWNERYPPDALYTTFAVSEKKSDPLETEKVALQLVDEDEDQPDTDGDVLSGFAFFKSNKEADDDDLQPVEKLKARFTRALSSVVTQEDPPPPSGLGRTLSTVAQTYFKGATLGARKPPPDIPSNRSSMHSIVTDQNAPFNAALEAYVNNQEVVPPADKTETAIVPRKSKPVNLIKTAYNLWEEDRKSERGKKAVLGLTFLSVFLVSCAYGSYFLANPHRRKVFGVGIFFARGSAFGILFCSLMLMVFMSRTFLTSLRSLKCFRGRRMAMLLDLHREVHIFCGKVLVVYSIIHTVAHCAGTLPSLSRQTDIEALNLAVRGGNFERAPTYPELVVSLTGVTGVLLVVVMILISVTSIPYVRTKYFEVFWYTHHLYWVYFALMIAHGSSGWLSFGIPLAALVCGLGIISYSVDCFLRGYRSFSAWQIRQAVIPEAGNIAYLTLNRNRSFNYQCGQVAWINVPEISLFQWHPFSICSHPNEDPRNLRFMIGNSGGWTGRFISIMQQLQAEAQENHFHPVLPTLRIDGPFGAPAQFGVFERNVVFVGAGTGVAAFLGYMASKFQHIRRYYSTAQAVEGDDAGSGKKSHFFWISRDPMELSWVLEYATELLENPFIARNVTLHIYITAKEPDVPRHFRVFTAAIQNLSLSLSESVTADPPLHVKYGRPTFIDELRKVCDVAFDPEIGRKKSRRGLFSPKSKETLPDLKGGRVRVFACARPAVTNAIESACKSLRAEGHDIGLIFESF